MSNFETGKPAVSEREDGAEEVSARLEEIKSTQIGDLSPEELMLLAGERQALAERKDEAVMDKTYEEALGENAEYDAKKVAEQAAQEKQKAEDMAQEQADKERANQIAQQLKSGDIQSEQVDSKARENFKHFLKDKGYKESVIDGKSLGWSQEVVDSQVFRGSVNFLNNISRSDIESLTSDKQVELAQGLFDEMIGDQEMPNMEDPREAYALYLKLKGTPFAEKFKTLEDQRLRKFGYSPFDL